MTPVRVLQVLTCDGLGGTEMMVATLVERLDRSRVQPTIVALDPPGPIAERLSTSDCPVRSLGGGAGLPMAFTRLARLIRRERFDVINAYGFKSTTVVRCLVRILSPRTRFVSGVRGLHVAELEEIGSLKSRVLLTIERLASSLVDAYDANSPGALRRLAGRGVNPDKLHYIPNGLDVDSWPAKRWNATPEGAPTILCVARFVPRKRQRDLIEAAAILEGSGVRFQLVFAGDGPGLAEAQRRTRDLGLTDPTVVFHGGASQDEVRALAADSEIFCLPSLWEGMAGAVMEAMACGLPVVGTNVNGIADLVEQGQTGLLVPPGDPERLAGALGELLEDGQRRSELGTAGRQRIREHFGVDSMVLDKQRLFCSLAEQA